MRVLVYNELKTERIPGFKKVYRALAEGNFAQADVRKIGDNLYRARLSKSDRLLFSLHRAQGETCCLLLEHIRNHAYDKSRFLRRAAIIDEEKIESVSADEAALGEDLPHVNPEKSGFNLLDKVLSFDPDQEEIYDLATPLIIVGSAGSGKTAVALEKMKQMPGDVLYVSLSPYLVENARNLYHAYNYENDAQEISFLSYQELLESLSVPSGRPITARAFADWFVRQPESRKLGNPHKVFEEIQGVITGQLGDSAYLDRQSYLELGVKQSIFNEDDRERVYDIFEKYLRLLNESDFFDINILSHNHLARCYGAYDFIVIDEIQDMTTVQVYLILNLLRSSGEFILTGDSNQIVHPNFFSWSRLKSLFFKERDLKGHSGEVLRILHMNYRNTPEVTEIANRILKLKQARFGSVDRESNFLVRSVTPQQGQLQFLADSAAVKGQLDEQTRASARVAVLVMHPEQKAEARRSFATPLVFSVQEAKGLEYDSIILFNFVSYEARAFHEIVRDVSPEALASDTLDYRRAADKRDKSLEVFKFYINALYVAVTRAVRNVYWIEADQAHPAVQLLDLTRFADEQVSAETDRSSPEEWQREARRLEMQGRAEQAEAIRNQVLKQKAVPWSIMTPAAEPELASHARQGSKKERLRAFEYALLHWNRPILNDLILAGFKPALDREDKAVAQLHRKYFDKYDFKNPEAVLRDTESYGIDHRTPFNITPLMIAGRLGNANLAAALVARGADTCLTANHGFMAVHFALERALFDESFAHRKLPDLYPLLAPTALDVQTEGRLVKLDQRLMEYFLVHLMSALFYRWLGPRMAEDVARPQAFSAAALTELVAHLPDWVLPERRKRRSYISSILSKNEIESPDRYSRKLFRRVRHGQYIISPNLKIRIQGAWQPYYQLFKAENLGPEMPWYYFENDGIFRVFSHEQRSNFARKTVSSGMDRLATARALFFEGL